MHRSYNPITPASSKLLQKRWDEHHYNKHRQSVNAVKPEIDSSPPITFMHLHLKLKKLQLEEERLATIERDNRILLEKMSQIMRTRGRIDNANDVEYKSLSRGRRQRELLRISKENVRMMRRITGKKSSLSVETLERDWRRNLRYMDNISAFPEEWYLMKEGSQSARPGLTNRSATGKQNKPKPEEDDHDHSDSDRKESRSKSVNNRSNENSEKKPSLANKEKKSSSVSPRKSEANEKKASDDEKKYDDDFEEN